MIFAFNEDGTLEILADADQARRDYEGVDVEAGIVNFYDERGTPLEARFSVPNRRGRFLGLFPWVESGVFDLVPAAGSMADAFALALFEAVSLEPNSWFATLDHLKDTLRERGVKVDYR
jgi:hypothetical protein